jgi:hypothetical protein
VLQQKVSKDKVVKHLDGHLHFVGFLDGVLGAFGVVVPFNCRRSEQR